MSHFSPQGTEYRIVLFGGPVLTRGGLECPLSPLQRGFLGLLYGWETDGLEREEIVSLFWPDQDPRKARRRLNQLLYSFQQRVGDALLFHRQGTRILRNGTSVESELGDLDAFLSSGRVSDAAQLLSRGFLRQATGSVSNPFSRWIEERERRLRATVGKRLRVELQECEGRGDWAGADAAAEAMSYLSPLDEGALRALMKARGRVGGVAEVERAFEDFVTMRKEVLGEEWSPREETLALLERIRSHSELPLSGTPEDMTSFGHEPPLVGRASEHALLRRTLSIPPHRSMRGILVTGEAGIGKTRLIKESVFGLELDGQAVLSAYQAELEQMIPLNPLIEALGDPRVGDTLALVEDPWRAVLYGVMPGHFRGDGPIPQAPQIQPGSIPRRLLEAFHELFLALVERAPVALVLEDLQWADDTTLSILEFLFRRWDQGRLQAVFSLRSEELGRSSALKSFLETLRGQDDFLEIPLGDLSPDASKSLIQNLSGRPLTPGEVGHVHALAGGNPFFLIELTLEYLAGRVDQPAFPDEALSIPLSIIQVLQRRLSQLSPPADKALGALSVHSKALRIEDLAKVAGLSTTECMSGLDQLHAFRLVRSNGTEVSAGHELIRQTVYRGLSDSRRAWLHERLARHLQESTQSPPPDELAIHFDFAGAAKEALTFAREAASKAEVSGAIPETLRFLRIARKHSTDPEEVAGIIVKMGHLNYLHQNLEEAAPLLEIAAQRCRRQGLTAEALRAELEWVDSLGQTDLLPHLESLEELERIKEEAKEGGHWETFMRVLDVYVHLFDRLGDQAGIQRVLGEAIRYSGEGDGRAQCQAQSILALSVYFGNASDGKKAARKAVEIALKTGIGDLELLALNRLIVVLLYQAELHSDEGVQTFAAAEERFVSSGDLILKFFIKLNRVVWHLEIGELHQGLSAIPAVEAVIKGTRAKHPWAMFHLNKGEIELELGLFPEAQKSFSTALSLLSNSSPLFFRTILTAGLGLCAVRDGDLAEAKRLEAGLPSLPQDWTFDPSIVATFKAEMLRMRGDLRMAERFLEGVANQVEDRFVTAWFKLNLMRSKILQRVSPGAGIELAEDSLSRAQNLGLEVRSKQFAGLLER